MAALYASIWLALVAPLAMAQTTETPRPTGSVTGTAAATQPAQKCASDLRAFDAAMQKEGNWLHGSGYGYGYPLSGYGYGFGYPEYGSLVGQGHSVVNYHARARPGYEIRTLIASATILAQRGNQSGCDALLTTAREIYKGYAADMGDPKSPRPDGVAWRTKQIAAAQPVAGSKAGYRSDQLIGADVVNPQGADLGDVYDVVVAPQTGKITYLVVARGGVFGIGEKHVPVPWEAFKITGAGNMLVLDSTKANLDAAPRVDENHFSPRGDVGQQGASADAFWKARILK
ncbi:MAG: PRC-barrel domain-containing protein [Burkholderiaceae bacterium]|nr:PRC-barrel domain-containing protein [Burkholderiaceae bacterium]